MKKVLSVLLVMIMAITSIIAFVPAMEVEAEEFEQQNILQVNANSSNDYISGNWYSLTHDSNTIRKAGCGIVSLVSAVYNLGGTIDKKNIGSVIEEVFDWAYSKGYWTGANATYWSMFTNSDDEFGNKYGFSVSKQYGSKNSESTSLTALVNHIKNGTGTAVVHVYGHFMVVVDYKVDSGKEMLRVFDPAPGAGSNYNSINRKNVTHAAGDWFELSVLQRDGGTKGTEGSTENIEIDAYWLITPTSGGSTQPTITPATITEGTYYFSNDGYKMYMISDTSGKNNIGASNGTADSKYQFNVVKDGSYYKIVPVDGKNGYVLNSYWASGSTTKNGDEVTLYKNTSDPSQRWIFEKCGDGYLIHPADDTHLSITRDGSKLYVKTTTKEANQIWTLESPECSHTYDNACDTSCNTCGYTRSASHEWTYTFDGDLRHNKDCAICGASGLGTHWDDGNTYYNDNQHYLYCTRCKTYYKYTNHIYTNQCDTTCSSCDYVRTITHIYDDESDASCNVCGETRTVCAHNYDNECDDTCNDCGAMRTVSHSFEWERNKETHYQKCSLCGKTTAAENHKLHMTGMSTDEQYDDYHWYGCDICKYAVKELHKFDNDCDKTCNVCGEARNTNHVYDNKQDEECNECGFKREVLSSNTNHISDNGVDNTVDNNDKVIIIAVVISAVALFGIALVLKIRR